MYKILLNILIIFCVTCQCTICYEQFNDVEQNIYGYEFKPNDSIKFLRNANYYLYLWENETDKTKKNKYLQEAMRYYYLLSKADKSKIEAYIGLGKVYDEMNMDRYAKQNFSIAYNINNNNPELNYRFGDFYYKRKELQKAQFYYNRAYNLGLSGNQDLRNKMSKMYNMLAEENLAKKYAPQQNNTNPVHQVTQTKSGKNIKNKSNYAKISNTTKYTANQPTKIYKINANYKSINPNYVKDLEHANKIRLLDDVNLDFWQYYLFTK